MFGLLPDEEGAYAAEHAIDRGITRAAIFAGTEEWSERAALAWTEAVTLVADTRVPDDVYEAARAQFSELELVQLTYVIGAINTWNRLNVAFRIAHPVREAASK